MSINEKKLKQEKTEAAKKEKVKKILKKLSSDRLDAILNTNQIPFIGSTAIGKMFPNLVKKNSKSQGSPTQRNKVKRAPKPTPKLAKKSPTPNRKKD